MENTDHLFMISPNILLHIFQQTLKMALSDIGAYNLQLDSLTPSLISLNND
jgi:hypothetical protein